MADFNLDYKIIGPQTYEDGRKLSKDSTYPKIIKVDANSLEEAKKKARSLIKNSSRYSDFKGRFADDAPKPRIKFLKPIKVGGTGDSPIKEISPKMLLDIKEKLFKGGRVDKPIKGRSKYI